MISEYYPVFICYRGLALVQLIQPIPTQPTSISTQLNSTHEILTFSEPDQTQPAGQPDPRTTLNWFLSDGPCTCICLRAVWGDQQPRNPPYEGCHELTFTLTHKKVHLIKLFNFYFTLKTLIVIELSLAKLFKQTMFNRPTLQFFLIAASLLLFLRFGGLDTSNGGYNSVPDFTEGRFDMIFANDEAVSPKFRCVRVFHSCHPLGIVHRDA